MQRAGVRGVRINMASATERDVALLRRRMKAALDQISGRNWHLQMYLQLPLAAALFDDVMAAPVPVVFDHFAGASAASGVDHPRLDRVLNMVQSGKAYVKVSAAYRASQQADYADVAPMAKALIATNPQRILWGSDWPHPDSGSGRKPTETSPLMPKDDGRLLNLLATWAPDAETRKTILVNNPARLYGFQ
jgi:predicted TIM-barrel fold metal-dependent hydrolase